MGRGVGGGGGSSLHTARKEGVRGREEEDGREERKRKYGERKMKEKKRGKKRVEGGGGRRQGGTVLKTKPTLRFLKRPTLLSHQQTNSGFIEGCTAGEGEALRLSQFPKPCHSPGLST